MSVVSNNILAGASGQGGAGYEIERSLRFNASDSAHLSRTPSSAGNRKTWTWSGWVKFTNFGQASRLFAGGVDNDNRTIIHYDTSDNSLKLYSTVNGAVKANLKTVAKLRDPSAFYHIVVSFDAANTTASIYINGVSQSLTVSTAVNNVDHNINNNVAQKIGQSVAGSVQSDFYLADVHFIDGQALAPTDFVELDDNNVYQPKKFAGTYGTNGFHLDFADNSSNAALGTDTSGNSNTWTVNNLTATTGTARQGFDVVTYTGTGSTQSISSLAFQPDFVWIKERGGTKDHNVYDIIRGATKELFPNGTGVENTLTNGLTSFDSDGFTLGAGTRANGSGQTYVAWAWKANGAAVSNTDGTITSQVSANDAYGFSIVSWTGNSTAGATLGHGLSTAPKIIIVKNRSRSTYGDWVVGHDAVSGFQDGKQLYFDSAPFASSEGYFNNTSPTSTVFTVKNNYQVNYSGDDYVAYVWSEVAGFSKISSYTGNGSSTGPVVTTGFKPAFVLLRNPNINENWLLFDRKRDSSDRQYLVLNDANPEGTGGGWINFLDDGFQIKATSSAVNPNGQSIIYMAFAEQPDGSVIDSLIDTPTNATTPTDTGAGGEVVGNYATLNPLQTTSALSNGNLDASLNTAMGTFTTFFPSSGKWYCEVKLTTGGDSGWRMGVINDRNPGFDLGSTSNSWAFLGDGRLYHNGVASSYGSSVSQGANLMLALDIDNGKVWYGSEGNWFSSGNPATGANPSQTFTAGQSMSFAFQAGTGTNQVISANFGARSYTYTAPSGFKSLNTANLPEPTIADGSQYFDTKLYTGNGGTQSITGYNFSPDFAWIKNRSAAASNNLADTVRGVNKVLFSDGTGTENTDTNRLTAFNSDGFDVGSNNAVNGNGNGIVGWAWDAGSSTVTNTDGSTTAQVRASAASGFSIVSWTGNNNTTTIGHGLGKHPDMILLKNRTGSNDWIVYHAYIGNRQDGWGLNLNKASAAQSNSDFFTQGGNFTSTKIPLGALGNRTTTNIAYVFTSVEGFSKFGRYTGNGSADGPFVYTGFKVAFLLLKCTNITEMWMLHDSARDPDNVVSKLLQPHTSDAEIDNVTNYGVDFLSNGFKFRSSTSRNNGSGNTYIYMAFAENPFKTARAR